MRGVFYVHNRPHAERAMCLQVCTVCANCMQCGYTVCCVGVLCAVWMYCVLCGCTVCCVDVLCAVWMYCVLCGCTVCCVDVPYAMWMYCVLCGCTVCCVDVLCAGVVILCGCCVGDSKYCVCRLCYLELVSGQAYLSKYVREISIE